MKKILTYVSILFFAACSVEPKQTTYHLQKKCSLSGIDRVNVDQKHYYVGGYGSSMDVDPHNKKLFYLLTDRGPNYSIKEQWLAKEQLQNIPRDCDIRGFADTTFVPRIGIFEYKDDSFKFVRDIPLKTKEYTFFNGLTPELIHYEASFFKQDNQFVQVRKDNNGIDPEGLAVAKDGSFWVSEEYFPAILHFNSEGLFTGQKLTPFSGAEIGTKTVKLPKVLARRQINAGIEGLCLTNHDSVLVGIIQRGLVNFADNHKEKYGTSTSTRLFAINVYTGETKEYIYPQEQKGMSNSEVRALNDSTFYIIERDGKDPLEMKKEKLKAKKYIFKATISYNSTNINDPEDKATGLLFDGKTVEELSEKELAKHQIVPMEKELIFDAVEKIENFSHPKIEGLTIVDDQILFVNDNDFGIEFDNLKGEFRQVEDTVLNENNGTVYFLEKD